MCNCQECVSCLFFSAFIHFTFRVENIISPSMGPSRALSPSWNTEITFVLLSQVLLFFLVGSFLISSWMLTALATSAGSTNNIQLARLGQFTFLMKSIVRVNHFSILVLGIKFHRRLAKEWRPTLFFFSRLNQIYFFVFILVSFFFFYYW